MKRLPKLLMAAVAMTAAVGLLSACGTDSTSSSQAGTSSHVLTVGKLLPLQAVDPHKVNDGMSNEVLTAVFDGLYTLDADGQIDPLMAESVEKSDDGLTYTFTIRDASWSNGTPVTAQDFEYSWKRLVNPATAAPNSNEAVAAGIRNANEIVNEGMDYTQLGVTALDDKTLQVQLAADVPYFQALLVRPAFLPVNQAYLESVGDTYGQTPETTIYNGPFVWDSWDFANNFSVAKNADYWNASGIDLDAIKWQVVKDSQTAALLQESGDLDFTEISGSLIDRYTDSPELTTALEVHMWYFYPNLQNPALANEDIRTALATSFDKEALADEVLKNGAQPADYFVGQNLAVGPDGKQFRDTGGSYLAYDLDAAQAAWTKGLAALGTDSVSLTLSYWDDEASIAQAEYVASQWEANLPGLSIELTSQPKATANEQATAGDFDLYLFRWGPDYKDPMAFLELLSSTSARDFGGYANPEYDSIIAAARTADMLSQPEARWQSLHDAEDILMGDVAVIPTVQNGIAMLINPAVQGMEVRNVSLTWNYRLVTKDD
ncbi:MULTISPECIES: peptide ABC transporter substrate-binding protein [unclassified Rathayibacter]|uniref:peptide ABC transporter substrate-binding protein n=1 Tax=unclassified Rathayibacter TaxID=2609250 RepID=UPI000CE84686|nr:MULTISPECIES: peptide ABC transporter substrate-binding protein [unclassified Rathayibacter]PPI40250.1 peptide ABC transporter substrate-binding protein [Rathayibacter sp. RFBD1]PPI51426.1 peptide ABC transporter substrate-binding protein [Rathayibacter sp. TRS19]